MRLLVLLVIVLLCSACGNNAMREQWDDTRDTINKPFK